MSYGLTPGSTCPQEAYARRLQLLSRLAEPVPVRPQGGASTAMGAAAHERLLTAMNSLFGNETT